jgi:type I restriction enzyme M protein
LHRFSGVVQGWLTTIESAFSDDEDDARDKQKRATEKRRAREHPIVPALIPAYLNDLEEAEGRRVKLEARLKAAAAIADDEDDFVAETLSPEDLKNLRVELAAAKRQVKRVERAFLDCLREAVAKLSAEFQEALVLRILKADLHDRLDDEVAAGRRDLINRYRAWADKYAIPLQDLEAQRDAATTRLNGYLEELGYV